MSEQTTHLRVDPFVGTVLDGQYRIDDKIGEGGMGAVYRATQLTVDRPVAIKVLHPYAMVGEERDALLERFKREARATSKLRHPNSVRVFDFGQTPSGTLYLVLELLSGSTLTEVLQRSAPLAPHRAAYIAKQVAKSLAEAHAGGIVHRDLKPDNIFICDYANDADFTKVMDFGIARVVGSQDQNVTRTGMMIGTPKYIAPEQAMAKKVSPAADLYSLGVILYEMLAGMPPFSADSGLAMALKHINDAPPPLSLPEMSPELAEHWRGLVEALMTKDPARRPQSAAEVAKWLGQLDLESRVYAAGSRETWSSAASAPGGEKPSTYEGPSPKQDVTVSQRVGRPRGGLWLGIAAVILMGLGGLLAWLVAAPSSEEVARPSPTLGSAASPAVPATASAGLKGPDGPAAGEAPAASPAPPPTEAKDPAVIDLGEVAVARQPEPDLAPTPAPPPPPTGPTRLVLDSIPTGAVVMRGRARLCTTPCDINLDPEAKQATLKLKRRGHRSEELTFDLEPGLTLRRVIQLSPTSKAPTRRSPVVRDDGAGGLPALRLDGSK